MPPSSVRAPVKRLVIASANPGKLAEFCALLQGLPFELTSMGELDLPSPEETGASLLANALLKARHAAAASGLAAIADDSGLEVDALDGAPGILSARYAGVHGDDRANNDKLQRALQGVAPAQRSARYRCALVLMREVQDPEPLVAEGTWQGVILHEPRGAGGFGYDPYFYLPELGLTAAQLPAAEKNRLSHRGQACRALRAML